MSKHVVDEDAHVIEDKLYVEGHLRIGVDH